VSNDVVFSETTPFFYAPPSSTIHGEKDEWLVYQVTHDFTKQLDDIVPATFGPSMEHQTIIVPSTTPDLSVFARSPITQVYSRRQETNDACPAPTPSSLDLTLLVPLENLDLPISLRKGTRTCKSTYSIANFVSYDRLSYTPRSLISSLDSISVPKTVNEALNHPRWSDAMLQKIHALEWVFTIKVNPDGSVARLKAILVAKGYAQTYGVDYLDTFSPIAKITFVTP